ncbi:MAG TPA: DUF2281 domain-containing protein [Longimicrobiales bacterium]
MHDVMRKRLWRKLEALPEDQLYQVLDFIEFLEAKYAPGVATEPTGLQRFAERLEDRLRVRDVAPRAMGGTMKLIGTAGRMLDSLAAAGQGVLEGLKTPPPRRAPTPAAASATPPTTAEDHGTAATGSAVGVE